MERVKKIFIWNANTEKYPWTVAIGPGRVVAKLANEALAKDYAKKLLGREVAGCFGQEKISCIVDEFAKFVMKQPE